jgi:sigma-B regulation protein RsbU (phosphoserine phosphatase)
MSEAIEPNIEKLEKDNQNLKKLIEITKIINATLDIGKLLNAIMEAIKNILNTEASSLLFYDEKTDELVFKAAVGEASQKLTEKYRFRTTIGIAGFCAANRESLIVNDVYSDDRFNPQFDKMTGFTTRAVICCPLLFKGKLIGVVEGINPVGRDEFNTEDLQIFNLFGEQAVMAVQNAIVFEESIERNKMKYEISSARMIFEPYLEPVTHMRDGINVTMITRPGGEFSGDIFTSREENDHIAIMLADSGKSSLPGSITASYIAGKITAFARVCKSSSEILRFYSKSQRDIEIPENSSLFYGKLYTKESKLEFSSTGTICILHINNGKIKLIRANSNIQAQTVKKSILSIEKDDVLLLFTEGITRLRDVSGEPFGIKNVAKNIDASKKTGEIIFDVLRATKLYSKDYLSFIDQTLICIKHQ